MARHVLTSEVKYFLSKQVPGRDSWSLRKIFHVAFGRFSAEDCFREAEKKLGLDHFECRSWHCIHRHLVWVILSHLFCARAREKYSVSDHVLDGEFLTAEQVCRAINVVLEVQDQPPRLRQAAYEAELAR